MLLNQIVSSLLLLSSNRTPAPSRSCKGCPLRFHELLRLIGSAVLDSAGRSAFRPSIKGSEALSQELSMNCLPTIPLFSSGQIVATPTALALLEHANRSKAFTGDGIHCARTKVEVARNGTKAFRVCCPYR